MSQALTVSIADSIAAYADHDHLAVVTLVAVRLSRDSLEITAVAERILAGERERSSAVAVDVTGCEPSAT